MINHLSGELVTNDEPTNDNKNYHHFYSKSIVYIRGYSWWCIFNGLFPLKKYLWLYTLNLMAKNLADPGPHLCQVHWNQRTSHKAMMPVHDP